MVLPKNKNSYAYITFLQKQPPWTCEFIARFYESFKIYQVSGEWEKCVKKCSQTVIFIEPLFNETSGCLVNHIRHLCIGWKSSHFQDMLTLCKAKFEPATHRTAVLHLPRLRQQLVCLDKKTPILQSNRALCSPTVIHIIWSEYGTDICTFFYL